VTDRRPDPTAAPRRAPSAKNQRLARALRDNLGRRKAQARARADTDAADLSGAKLSPKSNHRD
jgi:hypothetical protein